MAEEEEYVVGESKEISWGAFFFGGCEYVYLGSWLIAVFWGLFFLSFFLGARYHTHYLPFLPRMLMPTHTYATEYEVTNVAILIVTFLCNSRMYFQL